MDFSLDSPILLETGRVPINSASWQSKFDEINWKISLFVQQESWTKAAENEAQTKKITIITVRIVSVYLTVTTTGKKLHET